MSLNYVISKIVNWVWGKVLLLENILLLFFTDFKLLKFYNNTLEVLEILNKWSIE